MKEYTVTVAFKIVVPDEANSRNARETVNSIIQSTKCAELDHIDWEIVACKDSQGLNQ